MEAEAQELSARIAAAKAAADAAIGSRDAAGLRAADAMLASVERLELGYHTMAVAYRRALVAERLGDFAAAAEHWIRSFSTARGNAFVTAFAFQGVVAAGRWKDALPMAQEVSLFVLRRHGVVAEALERALSRFCLHALMDGGELCRDPGSQDAVRLLLAAKLSVEAARPARLFGSTAIAEPVAALAETDAAALRRVQANLEALQVFADRDALSPPWILLYLVSAAEAPRPDFVAMLRTALPRLKVGHLEFLFGHSPSRAMLPEAAPVLLEHLAGVIILATLVEEGAVSKPDLGERFAALLPAARMQPHLAEEVRFAEEWLRRRTVPARRQVLSAPAATRGARRVAVCLFGQMRGFERAAQGWLNLLDGVEFDIFVSTWRKRGRRALIPGAGYSDRVLPPALAAAFDAHCGRLSAGVVLPRFPHLAALLQTGDTITEAAIRAALPQVASVRIDEDEDHPGMTPQARMFHHSRAAFTLAMHGGRAYSHVLRMRPDIVWLKGHLAPMLEAASSRPDSEVWLDTTVSLQGRMLHRWYGFIAEDRVAFGTPPALARFLEVMPSDAPLPVGMLGYETGLIPHRSLAFHLLLEDMGVHRLPIEFGKMFDPAIPDIAALRAAIEADAAGRHDEIDRAFLAALTDAEERP